MMKRKQPKVSICIPTYNRAKMISDAIDSVLSQTFEDFELIVSDNSSEDETVKIVSRYSDSRIRLNVNNMNLGIAGNFNKCLGLTKGDYIIFLCSDDIWGPHILEKKVQFLEQHPKVSFVHSGSYVINQRKEIIGMNCLEWQPISDMHQFFKDFLVKHVWGINLSSCMIRGDFIRSVGGFDENLPQTHDAAMWLRLSLEGDVGYISEPLVYYRVHDSSFNATKNVNAYIKERLHMIDIIFNSWPQIEDSNLEYILIKAQRSLAAKTLKSFPSQRLRGANGRDLLSLLMLFANIDARLLETKYLAWALGGIMMPRWFLEVLRKSKHIARRLSKLKPLLSV